MNIPKGLTNTGAPATLLVFNNEKGFSPKNVESVCSVGRSTKKGARNRGYIGEKGLGFKSLFAITAQPHIISNGYRIRFNEQPCTECNIGYIVPEWIDEEPILSSIKIIYGSTNAFPATTLVLPLKEEKVEAVKGQLSGVNPEVLLFLSQIKRLSIREHTADPMLTTLSPISISSDKHSVTSHNMASDSYMIYLIAEGIGNEVDGTCGYHIWKQRFPVKQKNQVDIRSEVHEWVITLAFPTGKRFERRGARLPEMYSFFPTEVSTNFPFILQADFLFGRSRENILWNNIWNKGILDCVPHAYFEGHIALFGSNPDYRSFMNVKSSGYPSIDRLSSSIVTRIISD